MTFHSATSINQIAYVVDNLETSVAWWNDVMGVGPFLSLRGLEFDSSDYRGKSMPIRYSAALAFSGDLIVELIEPSGPSIFEEYRAAGKTGVQHICVFSEDFEATVRDVESRGGRRLQGGQINGGYLGYYEMGGDQGIILEVAQLAPAAQALFSAVRDAAKKWNGKTRYFTPDPDAL